MEDGLFLGYDQRVEQAWSARGLHNPVRSGIGVCWLSVLSLPIGLAAIGGGPCAGPHDSVGSVVLICAGLVGMGTAGYGVFRVVRGFRQLSLSGRALGAFSVLPAALVIVATTFFLFVGFISLQAYLG